MLLDDHTTVDLDDMFGVRRALETLPEPLHDGFLDQWRGLTESRNGNVAAIHTAVTREAKHRALRDSNYDPIGIAWRHISEAMTLYLAWRADR